MHVWPRKLMNVHSCATALGPSPAMLDDPEANTGRVSDPTYDCSIGGVRRLRDPTFNIHMGAEPSSE
eukprot:9898938-Alexandrium_andersonii.AAC.1